MLFSKLYQHYKKLGLDKNTVLVLTSDESGRFIEKADGKPGFEK